jgi:DNA-binding LytR/AlgR family response regulator
MNKIKYIIAEDRQEHIEALQKAIQKTPYNADLYMCDILECVAVCIDGLETWAALQQHPEVQILFLDYLMPEMTGKSILELLKQCSNPPIVVLVTAYADTAMDLMTFYKNIAAPILKPVTPQRFKAAMGKVFELIPPQKPTIRVYYTLDGKRAERLLPVNEIVCIESLKRKIIFSYVNQTFKNYEKLESNSDYHTLTQLIDELSLSDFYRINHSYIINRQYIKGVSATDVEMKNGTLIGIPNQGIYHREAFLKWYQQK